MRIVDFNVKSIGCANFHFHETFTSLAKADERASAECDGAARLLRLQHSCTPTSFVRIKCDERGQKIRHLTL
jgi:hypothetical protein